MTPSTMPLTRSQAAMPAAGGRQHLPRSRLMVLLLPQ
jgi:hypothetical protein